MDGETHDMRVRLAAFRFLSEQTAMHGESLPRSSLAAGFLFEGQRVPLVGPQGIFKPAILADMPLTISTAPEVEGKPRRYEDELGEDGFLRYRYRGTQKDRDHRDNAGLRLAMKRGVPLAYLFGIVPGQYAAAWPVYIVGDNPTALCFTVAVDAVVAEASSIQAVSDLAVVGRRAYVTIQTQRRLHQQAFRQRVLRAYREQCAICRLRRSELLDAAHILPDGHPRGEPIVPNGLALCRLHHAAFDRHILGIRPDLKVELRTDILREADGPMLKHGLQGFQGSLIQVPRQARLRPDPGFLKERYRIFRKAG